MDHDPHAVLEGMVAAAYATGATRGFIYLRYEYPHTLAILERALEEARASGFLGGILGTDFDFDIHVRRGAGAYICGEETSLLNSLEGKHPFPRNRPPYPVTHGYEDKPTAVNNVETLASVPPDPRARGADWYRSGSARASTPARRSSASRATSSGRATTRFRSASACDAARSTGPADPPEGRTDPGGDHGRPVGRLPGATSTSRSTNPALRARGSFLGAGGIMVFDDSRDMVEIARQAMSFFAHESCGKCFPCRIGTQRSPSASPARRGRATRSGVEGRGARHRPHDGRGQRLRARDRGALITESLLRDFPEAVDAHLEERT